jgi:hypothetical protein
VAKPKYRSMTLCPDSEPGHKALHIAIQEGWEPLVSWIEIVDGQPHSSHIALRLKVVRRRKVR